MRPKSTFYASDNLRRLYRERVGDSMTQAEFAKRHKIGGQSMLAMIMSGAKPLPLETAPKLATALRCSIYEICPEMDEFIRDELVPALGKSLRRAAAVLAALFFQLYQPSDANAQAVSHNLPSGRSYFAKSLNEIHIVQLCRTLGKMLTRCLRGCFALRCPDGSITA